ncbi:MAG: hypothetical protein AAF447_25940 [Myxococcota bacterium]
MSDVLDDAVRGDVVEEDGEFFVGYLPTPPRTKRFVLAIGVALVLFAAGLQAALAASQRGPGEGLERSQSMELDGLFIQDPYPMIRFIGEDDALHTALFARGWKAGLGTRYAELDETPVHVRGRLFTRRDSRGPRHLFVLNGNPEPTELDDATLESLDVPEEDLGEVELEGVIVDSKCAYGQMRPGDGRGHRACAQLCIAGGIPPVFVTRDLEGRETHVLLSNARGGSAIPPLLEAVAEPLRLSGSLRRRGDLALLRLAR